MDTFIEIIMGIIFVLLTALVCFVTMAIAALLYGMRYDEDDTRILRLKKRNS